VLKARAQFLVDGVPLCTVMEELPRPSWGFFLREDIRDEKLYMIYRQIAKILLELSVHSFDKIGAPFWACMRKAQLHAPLHLPH
jgi:hypothetical protein